MSNRIYNKQTANCRTGSTAKIGSYGRGQNDIPNAVEAAAVTTKGIAPAKGKAQDITVEQGKVTGTSQSGMSDLKVADIRYDYDILQSSKDYFENNVTTINEALIQEEAKILFPNFSKVGDST